MAEEKFKAPKKAAKPKAASKSKPGPLKIEGIGLEEAVKKSFQKKKSAGGWPK